MGTRSIHRARSWIVAHLDWLDGYPVESGDVRVSRWQTVPRDGREPTLVDLSGPQRARVLRAARTLFREDRETLARMVPDPERWVRAVELAARGDEPWSLYSRRERRQIESEPPPFAWLCAARGEIELVEAWVDHRETFEQVAERIGLPFALQLCRLTTRVRAATILPLLRTFHSPLTYEVSTQRPPEEWVRRPPTPIPRGPSQMVEPLIRLVREALAGDAKRASAICSLWATIEPAFILRDWNVFWLRLEQTRAEVDAELRSAFEESRACRVAHRLKHCMGAMPARMDIRQPVEDILRITRRPALAHAAARALRAAIAPRSPWESRQVSAQTRAALRPGRSRTRWNRCVEALHRWSTADWPDEIALLLFRAVEADPFDIELITSLERTRNLRRLRVILEARRRIEQPQLVRLELLARAGASTDVAVQLHDDVSEAYLGIIPAAFRLSRDVATLRELLPRIAERPASDVEALAMLPEVHQHFHLAHLKHWIVLARRSVGLDRRFVLGLRPTPIETEHDWITRYPAPLHDALERLAAIAPDAERRAASLLSPDFRSDADIRRELRHLPPHARERRRALLHRLEHPRTATPARLRRLARRVEIAADLVFVERWIAAVDAHLRGETTIDLDPEMLAALRTLERPMRRLAERVLREGDLRDAPNNARFTSRMTSLGVSMAPWLDGIGVHELAGCSLALENDPVEVLKMGGYFSTCLSPGADNFFAAVIDAADVNKRVLYARDSAGVAARTLLALDARGELVRYDTFHRAPNAELDEAISRFIRELLRRMGTRYAPNPDFVEVLMGRYWYCDCPLPAPAGDDLVTLLADSPVDEVVARLDREVGLSTATLIATITRLTGEPSKARPVLQLALERRHELPDDVLRSAATLAKAQGWRPLAETLIAERAPRLLWNRHRALDCFVAQVMLKQSPRALLRHLRAGRRRKGWERESRPSVLLFAGRSLAAMNRPKKARHVLELAATRGSKAAERALATL